MNKDIAEIVCPSCMYGHDCLIRGKADITKCPTIKAILALIEQEQAEHDIEVADVAFDKGFDAGKQIAASLEEKRVQPIREALRQAIEELYFFREGCDSSSNTDEVIKLSEGLLKEQ